MRSYAYKMPWAFLSCDCCCSTWRLTRGLPWPVPPEPCCSSVVPLPSVSTSSSTDVQQLTVVSAGAGAIISVGLMRMLTFHEAEEFMRNRTRYPQAGLECCKLQSCLSLQTLCDGFNVACTIQRSCSPSADTCCCSRRHTPGLANKIMCAVVLHC